MVLAKEVPHPIGDKHCQPLELLDESEQKQLLKSQVIYPRRGLCMTFTTRWRGFAVNVRSDNHSGACRHSKHTRTFLIFQFAKNGFCSYWVSE